MAINKLRKLNLFSGIVLVLLGLVLVINSLDFGFVSIAGQVSLSGDDTGFGNYGNQADGILGAAIFGVGVFFLTKARGRRHGQASVEFMMSYGWAIIAAVIVAGILVVFGVFDFGDTPTKISLGPPLNALSVSVNPESISVQLSNQGIKEIDITSITISISTGDCVLSSDGESQFNPIGFFSPDYVGEFEPLQIGPGTGPETGGDTCPITATCRGGTSQPLVSSCLSSEREIIFSCTDGAICCMDWDTNHEPNIELVNPDDGEELVGPLSVDISDEEDYVDVKFYVDGEPACSYENVNPSSVSALDCEVSGSGDDHIWHATIHDGDPGIFGAYSSDSSEFDFFSEFELSVGESGTFQMDCPELDLETGEGIRGYISVEYLNEGASTPLTAKGDVSATVL